MDSDIELLKNNEVLPPLWMVFPYFRGSIGFRMGAGEEYSDIFYDFLKTLSEKELGAYKNLFPEPKSWAGYWEQNNDCFQRIIKTDENFITLFWNETGSQGYSQNDLKKDYNTNIIKQSDYLFFWENSPSPTNKISFEYFSQWYKSKIIEHTDEYCCMEQYMMAKKAKLFKDKIIESKIIECNDPRKIKALGRQVTGFDENIWQKIRYSIVLNGNYMKFAHNNYLRRMIKDTKNKIIVEASPYDGIWGIGLATEDENIYNPFKWKGENLLGFALMEVRDDINRVYKNENILNLDKIKDYL